VRFGQHHPHEFLDRTRLSDVPHRKRHAPVQRLQILWHITYYGIPRAILLFRYLTLSLARLK